VISMKRILILAVNPTDTKKLRLDEEVREIETVHRKAKYREEIEIISKWAIRVDDLRSELLRYQPNIVHFSGHGAGDDGLALENEYRQKQFVSSESLGRLFKLFENDVECVVLNACYSEVQAEAIYQHINCVVGMNKEIGDKAAIKFATGFYEALANGRNYQDSFEIGRSAIDLQSIPESQTPQIKIRDSSKSLLSLDSTHALTRMGKEKFNPPVLCNKLNLAQRLKKDSLEKRLAVLEENYQALERDYRGAGDADEKNRLQSKLDRKLEEIEEITKELNQINYGE
jgi:Effector-associated domain 9/CHAT domain